MEVPRGAAPLPTGAAMALGNGPTAAPFVTDPKQAQASNLVSLTATASEEAAAEQNRTSLLSAAVLTEAKRLLQLTWPLALGEFLDFSTSLISTSFVGHLGSLQLSAWVLAHTLINTTGLSLTYGVVSAMETFCGQAYGAQHYKLVGVYLQRGLFITTLVGLPLVVLWTQSEAILLALGQDAQISAMAARYIQLWSPSLLAYGGAECCRRYLIAQGIVIPTMVVPAICSLLTSLYNWFFIYKLEYGLNGNALAMDCLSITSLLLLVIVVLSTDWRRDHAKRTWHGWSWSGFQQWGLYWRVALPSTAMICLDWWSYELMILFAGWLPDAQIALGAMGIAFNTHACVFMLLHGMSQASSTRVANELGAGHPATAKLAVEVSAVTGAVLGAVSAALLVIFRRPWTRMFTDDQAVIDTMAGLMFPLGASLLGDSLTSVLSGVMRGCGRQKLGAAINLLVVWMFATPLELVLAFPLHLGVIGVWAGQACGAAVQGLTQILCLSRFDWDREARRAAELMHAHGPQEPALLAQEQEPLLESDVP